MKLKVKDMDIATGRIQVAILNEKTASRMDLHIGDRLFLKNGKKTTIAVLDIAESLKGVPLDRIGLFEETLDALKAKDGDTIDFIPARKPKSLKYIHRKLDGYSLRQHEIDAIVQDIVENHLTDVELTGFLTANYIRGMTMKEIAMLTKSMAHSGVRLRFKNKYVMDFHSIGGVPGNRTTPIVIPIVAAAGLLIPKTSSRAITSPAGTADTLEVITSVILSKKKLESIAKKVGAFMVWGGAINLAPADDKIIAVEHPLNIDPEGQMIASIMAKKHSVSATHMVLEIPVDKFGKIKNRAEANALKRKFVTIGKTLNIHVEVMITDGSQPVGNGIGPALEARDVIWVLQGDGPKDLREKSLKMAGKLLELGKKAKKGKGYQVAQELLDSGKAYSKFKEIIRAQGGPKIVDAGKLEFGEYTYNVCARKSGKLVRLNNRAIAHVAKSAGAPSDEGAGLFIHQHVGSKIKKGTCIYTVYSNNKDELTLAKEAIKENNGVVIR
jgi:AMP phosphorylase